MNAFQRNFVNEVKRADEMERKLRFFEKQIVQINDEARAEGLPLIAIDDEHEEIGHRVHVDDLEVRPVLALALTPPSV